MVALGRDEHLRLVLEAAERLGVDDAVAVALERRAQGARLLRLQPSARAVAAHGQGAERDLLGGAQALREAPRHRPRAGLAAHAGRVAARASRPVARGPRRPPAPWGARAAARPRTSAWNGQPVAACGAAASAVSDTEPRPHSARCSSSPSSTPATSTSQARRRVDVGPDQPGPDRSLVVGGVALGRPAAVVRQVGRVGRVEGARAERREQAGTDRLDVRAVAAGAVRQGAGQQRVRPQRRVVPAGPVDHVQQPEPVRAAEALRERRPPERGEGVPALGDGAGTPGSRAPTASALSHRAWISTALPTRAVTGRPSMRASIHVSANPSAPCRSSPSARSAPIP